jgi:hypothetical protein
MFKLVNNWARFDDSALQRPNYEGLAKCSSMAEPMCLLSLVHEMEDIFEADDGLLNLKEIREWCVAEIFKHVQRDGARILENVSPQGEELKGSSAGRLMNPGTI